METNIIDSASAYGYLKESPLFKFSLSSKELFHSNFLEWLSNVDPVAFKKLILQMAGVPSGKEIEDWTWPLTWVVKREYNKFDLCIVEGNSQGDVEEIENCQQEESYSAENGNEQFVEIHTERILFVLENKVRSIPYDDQLKRYAKKAEELNKKVYSKLAAKMVADAARLLKNDKWYKRKKGENIWYKWNKDNDNWEVQSDFKPKGEVLGKTEFYNEYAKEQRDKKDVRFILLSLAKNFPNKPEEDKSWKVEIELSTNTIDVKWMIVYYYQYVQFVKELFLPNTDNHKSNLAHGIIKEYCNFVTSLNILTTEWVKECNIKNPFLHFTWEKSYKNHKKKYIRKPKKEYIDACALRIHDLYQKLKYSSICTELFHQIKDQQCIKDKKIKVYPSNQEGLFKIKKGVDMRDKKYICVNYTYLHGEPLLEINIHPEFTGNYDIYYAIQVQGGVYEHGFQVRKWENNKEINVTAANVWDELLNDKERDVSEKAFPHAANWMRLPCQEDSETQWYNNSNAKEILDMDILPTRNAQEVDKPSIKENKADYNKYDMNGTTYIYQSRRIMNNAKIGDIIKLMIYDVEIVVNSFINNQRSSI